MKGERLRWLRTRCSRLFRRAKQEAALDAELQFHFDQLVAQFQEQGMSEREARLAAQREFGPVSVYREEIRDAWRPPELADLWRSLRFAGRSLARTPSFTVLAVLTLALGIGANTAMFTSMNTIILKPLPYPDLEQLDQIDRPTAQNPKGRISPADYLDLRPEVAGYREIAALAPADVSLSEPGQPAEFSPLARVSANFFSTLGVEPQLGRDFQPDEALYGNHRLLVISNRCWKNRFGGAPDVVGRMVRVNGEPYQIVGVLPTSFNDWRHLGWIDLFRPLGLTEPEAADRKTLMFTLIGRRPEGISRAESTGLIASFGKRLAADFPAVNAGSSWRTRPLDDIKQGGDAGVAFGMMIGLSAFVLLIACSNLANLLLARTMARAREFAVRAALGASRKQLLQPLLVESLLLSLAGGLCSILVAAWATDWLSVASTGSNGEQVALPLDLTVLAWAFLVSLLTALAFGIAPALFAMRLDLNDTLKSGARGAAGSRGHQRFRSFLIVGQLALAMTLLAGAAVYLRGVDDLNHRREGWESDQLVSGTVLLPEATYPGASEITAFQRLALERLEALPGVVSASLSYRMPFLGLGEPRKYLVEGQAPPRPGQEPAAAINGVSPRYFETVGTRVLAGRVFSEQDTQDSPRVYIINEAMAHGLFGQQDPIGRRLAPAGGETQEWGEIVGVATNVRSIYPDPGPVSFQLYQPMAQQPRPYNEIALRTAGVAPASLVDSVRATITDIDGDLPLRNLKAANERIERANYTLGVASSVLSSFAVLGLALASLGIYGVIARIMAQRTAEFGIRIALGARARDIIRIVLTAGIKLALLGSGVGLLGAFGVSRLIAAGFPGMRTDNLPVLAVITLLLIAVALVACYLPARRAARINPLQALRAE